MGTSDDDIFANCSVVFFRILILEKVFIKSSVINSSEITLKINLGTLSSSQRRKL